MASSDESNQDSQSLIEPPKSQEIVLHFAAGENVEISDDIRLALERLLHSFEAEEVEGYGKCLPKCLSLNDCAVLHCLPLNNCQDLLKMPCRNRIDCKIVQVSQVR